MRRIQTMNNLVMVLGIVATLILLLNIVLIQRSGVNTCVEVAHFDTTENAVFGAKGSYCAKWKRI